MMCPFDRVSLEVWRRGIGAGERVDVDRGSGLYRGMGTGVTEPWGWKCRHPVWPNHKEADGPLLGPDSMAL